MPNFVDDLTTLPFPKQNRIDPDDPDPNKKIEDVDWNTLCQASIDMRGKIVSLLSDVGTINSTLSTLATISYVDDQILTRATTAYVDDAIAAIPPGGGGGGDSFWEDYQEIIAKLSGYPNALIVSNDPNSRDNPTGVLILRNEGLPDNPMWAIGNPYIAGIGLEAWGTWFKNDITGQWDITLSAERSGTLATILGGVRRSAYESFIQNNDFKPWMRAEASSQAFNIGPGGSKAVAGNVSRDSNVVTVVCATEHKFGVGTQLWKIGGTDDDGSFGADSVDNYSFTVTEIVNATTFKYNHTGSNATSTFALYYSGETDVGFGRDAKGVGAVRVNNSSVAQFTAAGIVMPSGLSILSAGSALQLGADGSSPFEIFSNQVHVKEGFTFYNEGAYRSTGWYNGGEQVQQTQEVFLVGTGDGSKNTYLPDIAGRDWLRLLIKNKGQGSGNYLTIVPYAGQTIDGGATQDVPADAAVMLVSQGTDWSVWYSPVPFQPD